MWTCLISLLLAAVLGWPCPADIPSAVAAQSTSANYVTDAITFYRVPLTCHAARGLGCGSRAKPVLLDLQKRPAVREAWLNQTGAILAVVWKGGVTATDRHTTISAVSDANGVSMDELSADARATTLKGFQSRRGWHRGADVDQLSAQEARVIADRLLHRVTTKIPTAQGNVAAVEPALTEAIRRLLVGGCSSPTQCRDALLATARTQFNTTELAALREAIDTGWQPVGDER
jgi:hypothetical protein